MVLVSARQPFIPAPVTQALREQGVVSQIVTPGSTDGDLIDLAWEARPSHIVAISHLPTLEDASFAAGDDALLAEALSACATPARPQLVWVTAADESSDELARIRRSGVAYTIVRVGRLVRPSSLIPTTGREEILVPADLKAPEEGLTSIATLAATVVEVVRDEGLVGRTLDVIGRGEDAWIRAVESHGVRARRVSRGRARWSRFWGGPVLVAEQLERRV